VNSVPRSRQEIILRHIGHNVRTRIRHTFGRVDNYSGSMTAGVPSRVKHARSVFDRYTSLGGIPSLDGAGVLELGPGDSLAIGLLFAAAGASRVVCLDKFRYRHDNAPFLEQLGIDPALAGHVEARCGAGIEDANLKPESFDLIVSNAVLEEIPDPEASLTAMERVLRPGGVMLHQVDLSDYGMFSARGFHPLEFLTVPDSVWSGMTNSCGGPNREPLSFYRSKLAGLGFHVDVFYTDDYIQGKRTSPGRDLPSPDRQWLDPVRERLLPRYSALPESELAVYGVFLRASKPGY
jgi:SAM-dependent methyltransferase